MNNKFTIAPSIYSHSGFESINIEDLYMMITAPTGMIRAQTIDIERHIGDRNKQLELKNKLPILLANGIFNKRRAENLIEYSCYIVIDLDYDLPEEESLRDVDWDRLKRDPYVRLLFHSPRKGIKVLIAHNNIDPAHHEELYEAVAKYIGSPKADSHCKDIARANFICYDQDAHLNHHSSIFEFTPTREGRAIEPHKRLYSPTSATTSKLMSRYIIIPKPPLLTDGKEIYKVISKVQKWSDKKFPICKGERNSNIFLFASTLKDNGVPQEDALIYLTLKYVEKDFSGSEIEDTITKAYK